MKNGLKRARFESRRGLKTAPPTQQEDPDDLLRLLGHEVEELVDVEVVLQQQFKQFARRRDKHSPLQLSKQLLLKGTNIAQANPVN